MSTNCDLGWQYDFSRTAGYCQALAANLGLQHNTYSDQARRHVRRGVGDSVAVAQELGRGQAQRGVPLDHSL
jgi:hypothetical protein